MPTRSTPSTRRHKLTSARSTSSSGPAKAVRRAGRQRSRPRSTASTMASTVARSPAMAAAGATTRAASPAARPPGCATRLGRGRRRIEDERDARSAAISNHTPSVAVRVASATDAKNRRAGSFLPVGKKRSLISSSRALLGDVAERGQHAMLDAAAEGAAAQEEGVDTERAVVRIEQRHADEAVVAEAIANAHGAAFELALLEEAPASRLSLLRRIAVALSWLARASTAPRRPSSFAARQGADLDAQLEPVEGMRQRSARCRATRAAPAPGGRAHRARGPLRHAQLIKRPDVREEAGKIRRRRAGKQKRQQSSGRWARTSGAFERVDRRRRRSCQPEAELAGE